MNTLDRIPGRHEIAGALQRLTGRGASPTSLLLPGLGIFAAGVAAGAALAMLLAPKPGAELRREIRRRARKVRDDVFHAAATDAPHPGVPV
jgi:hypothetical protein